MSFFLKFKMFSQKGLIHFVSTRKGGVSQFPFNSLNLGLNTGDKRDDVIKNRSIVLKYTGFSENRIVFMKQIHSSRVKCLLSVDKYEGGIAKYIPDVDGIVTNCKGYLLVVLVADCVPVIFFDSNKEVIGVAHAGWRGIYSGIIQNVLQCMRNSFGSKPVDIYVGLGPSIRSCCYEVGEETALKFRSRKKRKVSGCSMYFIDLVGEIKLILSENGILRSHIEDMELCTKCRKDLFFSYRASSVTGRFAAGIGMF